MATLCAANLGNREGLLDSSIGELGGVAVIGAAQREWVDG